MAPFSIADKDYFNGTAQSNQAEIEELRKALLANDTLTDSTAFTDGSALQPQALETTLLMLLFQEDSLLFYKDLHRSQASSTLEEYPIQDGYGTEVGFVDQLSLPEEDDAELRRAHERVKYIRSVFRVGDVMRLVKQIKNAESIQVQAAMMRVLVKTEKSLFFGDEDMDPNSFNGLYKTVKSRANAQNVIDLRGATLLESDIRTGAEIIKLAYGTASQFYCSTGVGTSIDQLYGPSNYRVNVSDRNRPSEMTVGHKIKGFDTSYGDPMIKRDIFLNKESRGVSLIKNPADKSQLIEGKKSTKAPDTPTFVLTAEAGPQAGSQWKTTGDGGAIAGAYRFRVSAINSFGEGIAAAADVATVVATGRFKLVITPAGTGEAATAYVIYREPTPNAGNGATGAERFMVEVKKTGATDTFYDLNADLPGTSISFLNDMASTGERRTMTFRQLAPIHKQPLAKIGAYIWGFIALYGTPIIYAPDRIVVFKNVGVERAIRALIDL